MDVPAVGRTWISKSELLLIQSEPQSEIDAKKKDALAILGKLKDREEFKDMVKLAMHTISLLGLTSNLYIEWDLKAKPKLLVQAQAPGGY